MVIIQLIINKTYRNKHYICKDKNKGQIRDVNRQRYGIVNPRNMHRGLYSEGRLL